MTSSGTSSATAPAWAFDRIAEHYDEIFTRTTIGQAQRQVMWDALRRTFSAGARVLELNCGTGEDALFLARHGVSVTACDASSAMIGVAKKRKSTEAAGANVGFRVLANEELQLLRGEPAFDGAFSNFSGLNCVADVRRVAASLGALLKPGARLLVCLSTRVCAWEVLWYLGHGLPGRAFRRFGGRTVGSVEGFPVPVWYPTLRQTRRNFSPWFQLRSVRAVGLFVPPSYAEAWAQRHRGWISFLARLDERFGQFPSLRGFGAHVLLSLERAKS